jgi:two-component system CheB/CheR fusion protein
VVVVDEDLQVQVWNHLSEDLWGVRPAEAQGQNLLNLDFGLPVMELRPMLQAALAGADGSPERVLDAINRRGRPISVKVTCSPVRGVDDGIKGVFVLMEPRDGAVGDGQAPD